MSVYDGIEEFDAAICQRCGEGLVVRSIRTGAIVRGPFWRLTWTHADAQPGTDGTRCWSPPADPDPATIRRARDLPLVVAGFGGSL